MLWQWKVCRSSHFLHTSPWPSLCGLTLCPQHPSSGCSWISHAAPNIKWAELSHPQHEQAMSHFNWRWTNLSLSFSSLFVWRIRTKIVDFTCQHHDPFFQYIKQNLGEYLWENTLQLRSWGSDVKVWQLEPCYNKQLIIYTACAEM